MSAESPIQSEYKEIIHHGWSLVYNPEFEQYREKYKNIISTVKKVVEGEQIEGIEIKKINEESETGREYFLLKMDGEEFFVKKMPNVQEGGIAEFKAGKDIEKRLSKSGLDKVRAIQYIFAYTDNNVRYVVSKYEKDAENVLYKYMGKLRVAGDYKKNEELGKRIAEIQLCLSDYMDLRSGNMGYNPETDEIVLFDLNLKSDSLIHSSDDEL